MNTRAIVSYSPKDGEARFQLESVELRETRPNELLIEMVASGICHTDLFFAETDEGILGPFPRVLGHEGKYSSRKSIFISVGGELGLPVLIKFV
jgi:Zn-dependent alcohol dehydrogenase